MHSQLPCVQCCQLSPKFIVWLICCCCCFGGLNRNVISIPYKNAILGNTSARLTLNLTRFIRINFGLAKSTVFMLHFGRLTSLYCTVCMYVYVIDNQMLVLICYDWLILASTFVQLHFFLSKKRTRKISSCLCKCCVMCAFRKLPTLSDSSTCAQPCQIYRNLYFTDFPSLEIENICKYRIFKIE